jgi:penicillin-binding protein 1A
MGYTPQLLCGTWTGCDDRFIRFNSTTVGQGSSVALPIWAYFYNKISKDKNLAIDTRSTFVKPEVMRNDIIYDWINDVPTQLGAEGDDVGNGSAEDYSADQVSPNIKPPEEVAPESETTHIDKNTKLFIAPAKPNQQKPHPNQTPDNSAQQPKAVMPKKPG